MGALYIRDARFAHGGWIGGIDFNGGELHGFNLDGEMNFPTAFSGLLLLAAGMTGLLVALDGRAVGISPTRLIPVALLIGYMSLDEVWQLHERLEAWLDVDWQTIYLPVFLLAGLIGASLLPDLRRAGNAATLFVAGAGAWGVAQVIEALQWDSNDHLRGAWSIVPEETLEMTGSLLFLLAFLAIARHIVATEAPAVATVDAETRAQLAAATSRRSSARARALRARPRRRSSR